MKYQKSWFESLVWVCALVAVVALSVFSMKALYAEDPAPDAPATLVEETPALAETSPDPATAGAIKNTSLPFIQNKGQVADPNVLFYTTTFAGTAAVTATGMQYTIPVMAQQEELPPLFSFNPAVPEGISYKNEAGEVRASVQVSSVVRVVSEAFLSKSSQQPAGVDRMDVTVNSFIGTDRSLWREDLPAYRTVEAGEVWPGVRVSYQAVGANVEKIFSVAPGSDPKQIAMRVDGGTLSLGDAGELIVTTPDGSVVLTAPVAFQEIAGVRTTVDVSYTLLSDSTYSFVLGEYDRSHSLVIDPLLAATLMGGSAAEAVYSFSQSPSGDIYTAGYVVSTNLPTTSAAYQQSHQGGLLDAYIARFSNDFSQMKALTYVGGSSSDGTYLRTAFDASGYLYLAGLTSSADFPSTSESYDPTYNGGDDCFIIKMDPSLSQLIVSTFFGSAGNDYVSGLTFDSHGRLYLSGYSNGSILPTLETMYDSTPNGGYDVFVARFDSALGAVSAATYLGGSGTEHNSSEHASLWDATTDQLVIAGGTNSSNFPTTVGAYDTSYNGSYDVFISRFSEDLDVLIASTYVGGSGDDDYNPYESLQRATDGSLYVSTNTTSTNYPTTSGVIHPTYGGVSPEVVVSKLSGDLSTLLASTYVGVTGGPYAALLHPDGSFFVGGSTSNASLATTAGAYQPVYSGTSLDGFIARLAGDLTAVTALTYLGGNGTAEYVHSMLVGSNERLYVAMVSNSTNFPVFPPGGYDATPNGGSDVLLLQLTPNLSLNDPPTATLSGAVQSPGTNRVVARLTVSDIEKAETSAAVEYSLDNTTWHNATIAEAYEEGGFVSIAGNVISSIDTTTQTGTKEVVFWWDAGADTPSTTDASVYLRVTPSDPLTAGTAVTSTSFALNTQTGAGVVAVAPAGGGGGSVVVAPAVALPDLSVEPSAYAPPSITAPTTPGPVTTTLFGVTVAGASASPAAADIVLLVRYRDSSPLVQALQQLLNRAGVPVAATGAGSAGNETAYFGPRTVQSLCVFQARALPQYVSPFGSDAVDTFIWNALAGM